VTIAHDPYYKRRGGELGAQPTFTASFEAVCDEDFSAAVFSRHEALWIASASASSASAQRSLLAAAETDRDQAVADGEHV